MRKPRYIILSLVFTAIALLSLYGLCWSATYYVDATLGSDASADPTNIATPWQTIAKVNSTLTGDQSDTNVLFKKGETWREQLTVPGSGTSGHPFTFGAYGSGNKPIIDGSDLVTGDWTAEEKVTNEETGGIFSSGLEDETSLFTTDFTGKTEAGSNTLTVQTSVKNNGASAGALTFAGTGNTGYAYKTITSAPDVYARAYFKMNDVYEVDAQPRLMNIISFFTDTTIRGEVMLSTNGSATAFKIMGWCSVGSTFLTVSGNTITRDAWHYIEARMLTNTASGGMQIWLDGVSIGSVFTLDYSGVTINKVLIGSSGKWTAIPKNTAILYFDDVKFSSSAIGAYSAPSAEGSYQYNGSLATDPGILFNNTVWQTKAVAKSNMTTTSEWYWDDDNNRIYIYAPTGTEFVTTGYSVPIRNNAITNSAKDYVTVDGLTLRNALLDGVIGGSGTDHFTIKNCYIHNNGHDGIMISGGSTTSTYPTIQNNEISSNGLQASVAPVGGLGGGIIFTGADGGATRVENGIVEYNYIHDNGFDFHDHGIYEQGYQSIVRYNWFDSNMGRGIKIQNNQSGGADGGGNQSYYNLVSNNKAGGVLIECSHIAGDETNTKSVPVNNKVYNNTLYGNGLAASDYYYFGLQYTYVEGTPTGNEFKNNIIYAPSVAANQGYLFLADTAANSLTGLTFDNNIYYTATGQYWRVGQGGGENSTSLAQWQGRDYTGTNDNNSLESDPLFVNAAGGDFRLQSGSPAINAGVGVGLTSDYVGNAVPFGAAPEIGAYEYFGASFLGVTTMQGVSIQ